MRAPVRKTDTVCPTVLNTPAEDIVSTYAYDTAGRLDGLSHSQDGVYLAEYGYTLDANCNRTRIDITGSAVPTGYEACTYDALDRVDYSRYVDGGTATFGYDGNGNRTTVSAGGYRVWATVCRVAFALCPLD